MADLLLDRFLEFVKSKNLELYPAQEEAILELLSGKNVILNTPTGSGKSMVALALQFQSLATGRRCYYTSPIKALVNEKFFALCRDLGPDNVGMITGDATVNSEAPIICCTAEILMNDALRDGARAPIDDVIMDEFHYYSDRERGVAWQVPLLTLPQSRFLLMSATLGDTAFFEQELTRLTGRETVVVKSAERPVPLDFQYSEIPLHEAVAKLVEKDRAPIYLVSFTQRECAEEAQNFLSVDLCTKEEKKRIAEELEGYKFNSPYGKEIQKLLKHGMGIHHAALLPRYRNLVEKLAQKGLLKIIFGTDTLGVGVNIPIRTVLLTKLCKFDGTKTVLLPVRDFHQVCGRAGRRGYDNLGTVVVQAPEHVIENLRNEQKAAGDPKKLKKLVKRKPPEKGYLPWNEETFKKLISGQPEPLTSRFKVTHAMLLQVLSRPDEDSCRAMRDLIRRCHENDHVKKQLRKTAFQLFRSLVDRRIIELNPLRINVDLQEDFSLNHALSLYLIDTLKLIPLDDAEYAMNILTLVESILENPDLVLRRQLDAIKTIAMQQMKEEGIEFDERVARLDELEYPKPNRDFIYSTFNEFSRNHPWVGQENIRPKSIAREMYEGFFSFAEYIREYDLQRAEGLLLRYLSEVYKTLAQNVPDALKTDELFEVQVYFGSLVRQIDSSLIDDWERLRNPQAVAQAVEQVTPEQPSVYDVTRDTRTFRILVRNEVFRIVKALSRRDYGSALALVQPDAGLDAQKLEAMLAPYFAPGELGHSRILTDGDARGPKHFRFENEQVSQILVDPDGHNDWEIRVSVDFDASRDAEHPVLRGLSVGPV